MGMTTDQQLYIERTKKARKFAGKSQEETADFINVARPTYTNYERVRPMPQKYIAKFCQFTGVREKWLLSGNGSISEENALESWEHEMLEELRLLGEEEQQNFIHMLKTWPKKEKS